MFFGLPSLENSKYNSVVPVISSLDRVIDPHLSTLSITVDCSGDFDVSSQTTLDGISRAKTTRFALRNCHQIEDFRLEGCKFYL
jgi:hypothetical protein